MVTLCSGAVWLKVYHSQTKFGDCQAFNLDTGDNFRPTIRLVEPSFHFDGELFNPAVLKVAPGSSFPPDVGVVLGKVT